LQNYRFVLETALSFAISQDAFITAYNVINSIRNSDAIEIKTLSLYSPRGVHVNDFVQQLLNIIRDAGLNQAEVFARPAETNGVALIRFVDSSAPSESFVVVTVSQFPTLPPHTDTLTIASLSWKLPVLSCGKTWHPNQLLPDFQDIAFSSNPKLQNTYQYALTSRQSSGYEMPAERVLVTTAIATSIESPAPTPAEVPVPTVSPYVQSIDSQCLCDKSWDALVEFAEYLIEFDAFPFDRFKLPGYESGFNAGPVMHLHTTARQIKAGEDYTALDKYIAASKVSMTNRIGFWLLLTLPYFLESNPYRTNVLESSYHAPF